MTRYTEYFLYLHVKGVSIFKQLQTDTWYDSGDDTVMEGHNENNIYNLFTVSQIVSNTHIHVATELQYDRLVGLVVKASA